MKRLSFRILSSFVFILLVFFTTSCKKSSSSSDLVGNWVKRYSFEGVTRSSAVSFTIGDYSYVVGGYAVNSRTRLKDAWKYDPTNNQWTQIDSLPSTSLGRTYAVGFSANGKGYYGLGVDSEGHYLKDFYEYDPNTDTWTKIADFGGSARFGATAFSANDKGYVVSGYDGSYLKDLWEYNPSTNTWTKKTSLPGYNRRFSMSFVINNVAYVLGGESEGTYVTDFWAYDINTDTWAQKRDIDDVSTSSYDDTYTSIKRENGATFVINNLGYLATGDIGAMVTSVWEYDPAKDLWTNKTAFQGTARTSATGMTVQNRGFILLGKTSTTDLSDVFEFKPFDENNSED